MTNNSEANPVWLDEHQLAALVGPRTRDVFMAFRNHGPAPVDEIQILLACPSKTIYYQVGKLLKAGLLLESGSAKGVRRDRQVYKAVEGALRMPEGFQSARYERLAAKGVAAALRQAIKRFNETAALAEEQPELVDDLFINTAQLSLTGEQVKALKKGIATLLDGFSLKRSSGGRRVTVAFVMTPHESRLGRVR